MTISETKIILKSLYRDIDGYSISRIERKHMNNKDSALTYGEIDYESFKMILDLANPQKGEVFYDVGAGVGKAVFAAFLLEQFSKCIGIEVLKDLHKEALKAHRRFIKDFYPILPPNKKTIDIEFINANVLNCDLSDGDVFYISSTCFSQELIARILQKLEKTRIGSRIITLTTPFSSPKLFELIRTQKNMSWGTATVYVYKRI